jgi:uncharacterized membrane protein YccC
MKLDRRKSARTLILGSFVAVPFLWYELPAHSAGLDALLIMGFVVAFFMTQLGVSQSLYRDNRSLRKME